MAAIEIGNVHQSYTQIGTILYYRIAGVVAGAGGAKVEKVVRLPGNALLRPGAPGELSPWVATVQAGRAGWTLAAGVAQLRSAGGGFILDFGMLRTVAGVGTTDPDILTVTSVRPWQGAGFSPDDVPAAFGLIGAYVFESEIRTERLFLGLSLKAGHTETLEAAASRTLAVELPEAPADLDLRINGGPPVWTSPGPVVAGAEGWIAVPDTTLFRQDVDLGAALTGLLARPAASNAFDTELRLTLNARVPGALELATPPEDPEALEFLVPIPAPPAGIVLDFATEGRLATPLPLPSWVASVSEVRAVASGDPPPERVLPAVGPTAATVPGGGSLPLVELWLDPDRAAALELPSAPRFASVTGIRVPVYTDAKGAELSVLLLEGGADPGEPIGGAVSAPVTLESGQSDPEAWVTAAFPRPVPIDPAAPPYAALLVTRGRVGMALSQEAEASRIRLGPPSGPWSILPGLAGLTALRGRTRVIGKASKDAPIPPFALQVVGEGTPEPAAEIVPASKGVAVAVRAQAAPRGVDGSGVSLEVIGQVTGTGLTLRDLVVVVRSE